VHRRVVQAPTAGDSSSLPARWAKFLIRMMTVGHVLTSMPGGSTSSAVRRSG
jgi:hypothetical protein